VPAFLHCRFRLMLQKNPESKSKQTLTLHLLAGALLQGTGDSELKPNIVRGSRKSHGVAAVLHPLDDDGAVVGAQEAVLPHLPVSVAFVTGLRFLEAGE